MKKINSIMFIGILLIILGAAAIAFDQISYTRHEKLFDIGPVEATVAKEAHCIRLPVIFGALVIVAGLYLAWMQAKKHR